MPETAAVQIVTTTAERSDAVKLARLLIDRRLAACVQIDGPVQSHFRWEGALCESDEWRLTIKTTREAADRVLDALHAAHPYDEPELLILPVVGGSPTYLRWLSEQVEGGING